MGRRLARAVDGIGTLAAEQVHGGAMTDGGVGARDFAARIGEHRTVLLYILLGALAVAPVFMVDAGVIVYVIWEILRSTGSVRF